MTINPNLHRGLFAIVSEKDCTGCCSCYNTCKSSAINLKTNEIGHLFPYIDGEKCIGCGACQKNCPAFTNNFHQKPINKVHAAWAKDIIEHSTSTSGGLASVLARSIINAGGVAYGCASLPKCEFKHIRITKEEDVNLLKGSKYVQSYIGLIYRQVKKDLQNDIKVLFIGTPCQISGLLSFLQKDYDNLYTIDLVCHGVPSQQLLLDHINSIGINKEDITKVSFRDPNGYYLTIWNEGQVLYQKDYLRDLYYSGFNDALFSRESCVNCKYAKSDRTGDITLGDFHGLGKDIPFAINSNGNISLLTVNSHKGNQMLEDISSKIEYYKRSLDEALKYNPQLRESSHRKANYSSFVKKYKEEGYVKAAKSTLFVRRLKNIILKIKNIL